MTDRPQENISDDTLDPFYSTEEREEVALLRATISRLTEERRPYLLRLHHIRNLAFSRRKRRKDRQP